MATVEILFSETEIAARIDQLAAEIAGAAPADLLVIAILRGSFVFTADLIRAIHSAGLAPQVDFMALASYGSATASSGTVRVLQDLEADPAGRDVLIVDDILETGRTLAHARSIVAARGARSVRTCVLLDKPCSRGRLIEADYRGFECPREFVVGYGMDLAQRYRELPFIGRIRQDAADGLL